MENNEDGTQGAEKDMEFEQVLQADIFTQEVIPLMAYIERYPDEDQKGANNPQTLAVNTTGLEPVVPWVEKSLFQGGVIVTVSGINKIYGYGQSNGNHGANVGYVKGLFH
jgi:hypothetical protein